MAENAENETGGESPAETNAEAQAEAGDEATPSVKSSQKVPKRQADAARRLAAKRAAKAAAKASKRGTDALVPDGVEESVEAAASWFDENSRMLWVGLLGFVAIGFAVVLVGDQIGAPGRAAAAALSEGVDTASAPIIAEGEDTPEGVDESYPTASARAEKARERYAAAAAAHGGSAAADWAKLGEANALYSLGKYAEAQQGYAKLLGKDGYVKWRALEGLGYALEAQEQYSQAQKRFEELGGIDAVAPLGKYHAARMQSVQGKKDEALDTLEALIKAEGERTEADKKRFESVIADAETLLGELAVATGRDRLEAKLPAAKAATGAGGGLSQDIVDALRKQLEEQGVPTEEAETGEGKGLTKDIVDALQKNVDDGDGSATTTLKVPAGALPKPPNAPAPAPKPAAAPTAKPEAAAPEAKPEAAAPEAKPEAAAPAAKPEAAAPEAKPEAAAPAEKTEATPAAPAAPAAAPAEAEAQ